MSAADTLPLSLRQNRKLDRWVRFNRDQTLTLFPGRVEIGQGIITALAQIAADELDVGMDQVRLEAASTGTSPDEGHTSGSRSIDDGGAAVRYACAEIRASLVAAAAEQLGLPVEQLSVERGRIGGFDRIREVSYWQLPTATLLARDATGLARPKHPAQRQVSGKSVPRVDIPDKLAGAPRFVHDMRLPDLLHGRVVRPPSYEAHLEAFDAERVRALPSVVSVIEDGRFLGVVAEREEQAIAAAQAGRRLARWSESPVLPEMEGIGDYLKRNAGAPVIVAHKQGSAAPAVKTLRASYSKPYIAHASLGPSCALARWSADKSRLEVWTHSQGVYPLRAELAKVLRMSAENILVTHVEGAGCYGHNGADDAALDAVYLARAVAPRPVRLQWSREDEFAWEPYGPAMEVELAASMDESGGVVNWEHEFWSNPHSARPGQPQVAPTASALLASWHIADAFEAAPVFDPPMAGGGGSERNSIPLYEFPNVRVVKHPVQARPLRTSTLRGLGAYANVFAIESFIDELAALAGADPVEFRLRHMKEPRARLVIEHAASKPALVRTANAPRN
jgi:nicotinate dehydrogenase subunit B